MEPSDKPRSIRVGAIELETRGEVLIIKHHGKAQIVRVQIKPSALERWAIRQLREGVFQ